MSAGGEVLERTALPAETDGPKSEPAAPAPSSTPAATTATSTGGGGDEEEEWLYGEENEAAGPDDEEEEMSSSHPVTSIEAETTENGVAKPVTETEDDSDSDSDDDDDDVHVTIGDIKTGAPQYGSYGTAPVNLNIKTGGRIYGPAGGKVKGVDLDAPGSINGVPLVEVDLDSFEDKPWRKPGADLSDYFNYGFNEDTWKAYCEKQKRLRMGLEALPVPSSTNKITVQQGRTGNSEKDAALPTKPEFTSPTSLFKAGAPPPSRKLSGTIDVIGQTTTITRVEGRRRGANESNIQVVTEQSPSEVDNFIKPPPPFFPPGAPPTHLPPPPLFPPPPNVSTAPPLIPPPGFGLKLSFSMPKTSRYGITNCVSLPGFPPPHGGPPPSMIPTIESGHTSGYDGRSAPAFPYGSVSFPHMPGSGGPWSSMVEPSKPWDYYPRREKDRDRDRERERDRDRDRERDRERQRERERERDRERDHSPSVGQYNSEEERYRYKDYGDRTDRGYDRHRERISREKEERHRERRHREKEESSRHKSSRSSRRRHDSEEGDSHRRHKHKKSKRSKEGKDAGSEPAPEPESTEQAAD
ncbi:pre-mRNA 3'-end-processing factor FIP1 isoform 1-T1 [Gastrophryne carolinensis]